VAPVNQDRHELPVLPDPDGGGAGPERPEGLVFVLGSSRRTDLPRVEDELSDLWLTTGEEARLRGRGGVVRVRELNLMVYAAGEEMAQKVSDIVTEVAHCHPARVIVLLDQGPEPTGADRELEAWVTAACYVTNEGARQVCWEQITLPVWSDAVPKLYAAAVPLLVPDLPVVLWWPGRPQVESRLFEQLTEIADRVILDSSAYPTPREGFEEMRGLVQDARRDYILDDLNWARLTPWREMIAEPFDDPTRLALLPHARRLTLSYSDQALRGAGLAGEHAASARALLLAGWLGARLGWSAGSERWTPEGDGFVARMRDPGRPEHEIELLLRPGDETGCEADGLGEVILHFEEESRRESCMSISRSPETCLCAARFRQGEREAVVRTVEMLQTTEDRVLCDELDYLAPDPVYEEALALAVELASLEGGDRLWI
jgi:glucose-6-phosphate dehydrogenase assembly protein OpcA